MGTPGIPPTSFPAAVDLPLSQTGPYRFNKSDRAYIDSQIIAIENYVKALANGQILFSISQSCTVGGTIASAAAAGIGIIALTGSPAAAFIYTLPAGPGLYQIVNNAGQSVTVTSGGNSIVIAAGGNEIITTDGTNVYGPSSSTSLSAPTIWTASTYQYPTGITTKQNFDTTSNAISATIDATPTNGQLMGVKDVGLALGTHALTLVTAGASVEWPAGVLTTSNIVLNAGDLGAGPLWQWFSALSSWRLPS